MYTYEASRDLNNLIMLEHYADLVRRKHFHNCMELIYVVNGHATAHIDGEDAEIFPGQIVACPCFSTHYYSDVQKGEYIVILIPRRYFREYDSFFNSLGLASITFSDTEDKRILSLINMFEAFIDKANKSENDENSFAHDALYFISSLLVNLCIQNCGTKKRVRISSLVADAVCVIEDEFRNPLTVADVCKKTGYNQKDLTYHFNKTMNMSILDYIHRTRIMEAARLLSHQPDLPIGNVMLQSGFCSSRTFSRNFEKIFGCPPSEYRKNHANHVPDIEY